MPADARFRPYPRRHFGALPLLAAGLALSVACKPGEPSRPNARTGLDASHRLGPQLIIDPISSLARLERSGDRVSFPLKGSVLFQRQHVLEQIVIGSADLNPHSVRDLRPGGLPVRIDGRNIEDLIASCRQMPVEASNEETSVVCGVRYRDDAARSAREATDVRGTLSMSPSRDSHAINLSGTIESREFGKMEITILAYPNVPPLGPIAVASATRSNGRIVTLDGRRSSQPPCQGPHCGKKIIRYFWSTFDGATRDWRDVGEGSVLEVTPPPEGADYFLTVVNDLLQTSATRVVAPSGSD